MLFFKCIRVMHSDDANTKNYRQLLCVIRLLSSDRAMFA